MKRSSIPRIRSDRSRASLCNASTSLSYAIFRSKMRGKRSCSGPKSASTYSHGSNVLVDKVFGHRRNQSRNVVRVPFKYSPCFHKFEYSAGNGDSVITPDSFPDWSHDWSYIYGTTLTQDKIKAGTRNLIGWVGSGQTSCDWSGE